MRKPTTETRRHEEEEVLSLMNADRRGFRSVFFVALFRLCVACFFFSIGTHVAVPISLSPLVAFAPAGDREMGTEEEALILNKE